MYTLVRDDDSHWYVIPADQLDHWFDGWLPEIDSIPSYAVPVGGSPSLVKFNDYTIE